MVRLFIRITCSFLVFIIGIGLLCWNENRILTIVYPSRQIQSNIICLEDARYDPNLDDKVIFASDKISSTDYLQDDIFGVRVSAIRLVRQVEYYQWVEENENQGTCTYTSKWVFTLVNSSHFKELVYRNSNFTLAHIKSRDFLAKNVSFGEYELSDFFIHQMSGTLPAQVRMTPNQIEQWNEALLQSMEAIRLLQDAALDEVKLIQTNLVHINGNIVYFGLNPGEPQIGDLKITFEYIPPAEVTLVAKVNKFSLEEYKAKNGETFSWLRMGKISPKILTVQNQIPNALLSWIIRISSVIITIIGLIIFFRFLVLIKKTKRLIYYIIQTNSIFIAAISGLICSFISLSYIWMNHQLYLSIGLLILAMLGIILLAKKIRIQKLHLKLDYE